MYHAELAADPSPVARAFEKFVSAWAENAEAYIWADGETAIDALNATLWDTLSTAGHVPVGLVGQALVVLSTHWKPSGEPSDFFESMTPVEKCLYTDVAAVKVAHLMEQARLEREQQDD